MKFPPLNFDALTQANYLPSACKSFDYTVTGYIVSPIFKHALTIWNRKNPSHLYYWQESSQFRICTLNSTKEKKILQMCNMAKVCVL